MALGLHPGKIDVKPGIAYILQYSENGCEGECVYCSQSKNSEISKEFLSRVIWPTLEFDKLLHALRNSRIYRVCIQTVIKDGFVNEAHLMVKEFSKINRRVSLSITPIGSNELEAFREEGVDYIGVGLDAATERVFNKVRKPYSWLTYWKFIENGVTVFGKFKVITHIIIGMGERPEEALETIEKIISLGSEISLFAFTPLKGTRLGYLRPPNIRYYRFMQMATMLIRRGFRWKDFVVFQEGKPYINREIISKINHNEIIRSFLTKGCPGCNRPYYNESPGRIPYNYPALKILYKELDSEINKTINDLLL
jgi:biotin synthase